MADQLNKMEIQVPTERLWSQAEEDSGHFLCDPNCAYDIVAALASRSATDHERD